MGETAPFWRFSAASYPDLGMAISESPTVRPMDRALPDDSELSSGVCTFW